MTSSMYQVSKRGTFFCRPFYKCGHARGSCMYSWQCGQSTASSSHLCCSGFFYLFRFYICCGRCLDWHQVLSCACQQCGSLPGSHPGSCLCLPGCTASSTRACTGTAAIVQGWSDAWKHQWAQVRASSSSGQDKCYCQRPFAIFDGHLALAQGRGGQGSWMLASASCASGASAGPSFAGQPPGCPQPLQVQQLPP